MPLSFVPKKANTSAPQTQTTGAVSPQSISASALLPKTTHKFSAAVKQTTSLSGTPAVAKAHVGGFMKMGAAAKEAFDQEEAKAAIAQEEKGKLWRFWIPVDEERRVTFLDGDLDNEGMLMIPYWHEHSVRVNGEWDEFVCTMDKEGFCAICERGDSKSYFVGGLTVIDHTPHKIVKGQNAGKIIVNTRKLYIPKRASIKLLTKLAIKKGSLRLHTYDITRGDKDTPKVGSQFEHVGQYASYEDLAVDCSLKPEEVALPDWESEITYRTNDELVKLGAGKAPTGIGYKKASSASSVDKAKLSSELG